MNALLMQMITARAGGNNNPAIANILERMSPSNPSSALDIQELLAQQASTNPMAAMLAKHLAEQKASASSSPVIDVEASEEAPLSKDQEAAIQNEQTSAELSELRQNVKDMCAELKLLRNRNDELAAAVGACCLCWGQNLECRSCRGRGGPGFCIPDETLFEEFVLPAVQTLRAQKTKIRNSSSTMQSQTAAGDA
jgi:hypothetical protein